MGEDSEPFFSSSREGVDGFIEPFYRLAMAVNVEGIFSIV